MTSLCKKESICAVHEKQTQAKQLSVKQHVRQHGARLQVTDSDGITMRKRVATQPETSPRGSMHCPMGLQSRTTNNSPCALELSPELTRRILELSENYTHKVRCVAGGFGCELLFINRTVHCTGCVLGSLSGASSQGSSAWSLVDEAHPAILHHLLFVHI